ncbi:MAG: thiamine pyrophosphate-binding protein [SAR202 cluster bacterium]|jgi:acetolactate synthase-1/2/3 large subunit|nr:thiamine pyrophosphate-binding protein [SAR202 cluster bacterium]|tara:strand:- start:4153 stop:5829 length:1677 start_codon:yes stop_codon:yes gene_type:complete
MADRLNRTKEGILPKLTGGQAVVESLKTQGVDTVFGIISIHNLDLFDSLFGSQDSIQFVGGRLELGCGFMADGYARATGKPGVLFTSTGPGAADSVGAIGEAYFSGSPILEITTNVEQEFLGSGKLATHETKDQLGMFEAVTDWNTSIPQVESIPDNITQAFDRFQTRRPRPIELEIPTDLLGTEADVEMLTARQPNIPQGDPNQVEKALQMLLKAKRPAILVGEEVQQLGGTQQIVELAEKLGAAVVTSDGAKGAFPEDHAQSLGQIMGRRIWGENPVQEWLGTCDLVVVLGSIMPHRSTSGIGLQLPKDMVHVLLDGEAIGKNYPATVPIVANSQAVVQQWLGAIGDQDVHKGAAFQDDLKSIRGNMRSRLEETWSNELKVFETVRAVTPRNTIFSLDPTVGASRATRCLDIYEPRTYMHPHGWLGLGFAFPAAIGAKVGKPDSPVVCVTGDGGFQYNFQELATCAQYDIHPVVLMFNDNAWGVLKGFQSDRFGDNRRFATDLVNPDFVKIFESYGFEGTKVTNVNDLGKALESAIASGKTHLVEVQTPDGFSALT